jgi:putative DNA primase/helicase
LEVTDRPKSIRLKTYAEQLKKDTNSCQSAAGIRGVKEIAETWPEFAVSPKELDADPYVINLQNCTLDLRSEQCRPHDPEDLITKVCNATFEPEAFEKFDPAIHCPRWAKFLDEVLPDSGVRKFMQRLMGLALVGTQLEHILPILIGTGRNGKGVFEDVMRFVFGDYGVSAASDLFISKPGAHTTSQTDLMGTRLAIIDEHDGNARLSEALLKKLTGSGEHTARRMRQDDVTFHMSWLPVMITNDLPQVTGQGAAIWDRLLVIEFPRYFSEGEREADLDDKLKTEANGIFMWAYRGWLDYQRDGQKLHAPQAVKLATQSYRHKNDQLQRWIDNRCTLGQGPQFRAKPQALLDDYNTWADKNSAEQLGRNKFLELLRVKNFRYIKSTSEILGLGLRAPSTPGAGNAS